MSIRTEVSFADNYSNWELFAIFYFELFGMHRKCKDILSKSDTLETESVLVANHECLLISEGP